jgi:hypothetical protein
MEIHHEEEMAFLICHQWDLVACLEDSSLPLEKRQKLHLQLAKNVYQIAYIVDLYQNPLISFSYRNKNYKLYSDVIKDLHFELVQTETLLKHVFALHHTTDICVIEVGELSKPVGEFIHAGLEYSRKRSMF